MIAALLLSLASLVTGIVYLTASDSNFPFAGDIQKKFNDFVTEQGNVDAIEKAFEIECSTAEQCADKLTEEMKENGKELGWSLMGIGFYEMLVVVLSVWFLCIKRRD